MDINTLVVKKELQEAIDFFEKLPAGIYEFSDKYIVLREVSFKNKIYKRGDEISLKPSAVLKLSKGIVQIKSGDNSKNESIRKVKQYIDFRMGSELRDVTFSKDFSRFQVY